MPRIIARLPANRDICGTLSIEGPGGRRLAGPFFVGGRADDRLAIDGGNPERNPLLPFGDTPTGAYRVADIVPTGRGTAYPVEEFGAAGMVVLEATGGDAVLADANGRFRLFIHGGATLGGLLKPTEGSLRLANGDQRQLIRMLRQSAGEPLSCVVSETARPPRNAPRIASPVRSRATEVMEPEPSQSQTSRRSWLRTVLLSGVSFSVPGAIALAPQLAFGGSGTNYSQPSVNTPSDFNGPAISGPGTTNSGNPAPPPPPPPPPAPPPKPNLTQQEYNANSSSGTIPSPPPNNGLPPSPGVSHPYVPPMRTVP
jgi:hypothetical protein